MCGQLVAQSKEFEGQVAKLRYRIEVLVATVREGDANLSAALSADPEVRSQLAQKLAHLRL